MRVLLTCDTLVRRSGSQAYLRDVAVGLRRAGHEPVVYSPEMGEVAEDLKRATVPVVSDLTGLGAPPDFVHGNHHAELMTALLRFPRAVGLHVCHAWFAPEAHPPRFPRLRRYVAVDETVRDRLISEEGIPPDRVRVILNPVDLSRFPIRPPLPTCPRTALLFSNYAGETTHLPAVREACERTGLELTVLGAGVGRVVENPEELLVNADLVFAKARSALEALVSGAAVILCDATGSGPLVTARDFAALRRRNLGIRTLDRPLTAEALVGEIARYDAADAVETSRLARESASLEKIVGELVAVYEEALEEEAAAGFPDREAEERAAADYVRWLDRMHLSARGWTAAAVDAERRAAGDRVAAALEAERRLAREREAGATETLRHATRSLAETEAEVAWMRGSATWRLRERVLRAPGVRRAWCAFRRKARGPQETG